MTTREVSKTEYNPYYGNYINKVDSNLELIKSFVIGKEKVFNFFSSTPIEKLDYADAKEKWTIKEVFQHIIDTERIFIYRRFRVTRNDKTSLTSFDQNIYIKPSNAKNKTLKELLDKFIVTRNYSISLLQSFTNNVLKNIGKSNNDNMSARAADFTIIGHGIWHMKIIKERYL